MRVSVFEEVTQERASLNIYKKGDVILQQLKVFNVKPIYKFFILHTE